MANKNPKPMNVRLVYTLVREYDRSSADVNSMLVSTGIEGISIPEYLFKHVVDNPDKVISRDVKDMNSILIRGFIEGVEIDMKTVKPKKPIKTNKSLKPINLGGCV